MLSAQYGTEFVSSHYEKLKKVYSIWICANPPKARQNTITQYAMTERHILGQSSEPMQNYDMLSVVQINLSTEPAGQKPGVVELLSMLLGRRCSTEEKLHTMQDHYGITISNAFEQEVTGMCNLGLAYYEDGMQQGMQQGMQKGVQQGVQQGVREKNLLLAKMMIQDHEPVEKIIRYTELNLEQLKELADSLGCSLVMQ
jgi:hypothetical protein